MEILALVSDAFGGHGGIAKFNRDLLTALCQNSAATKVLAIPRVIPDQIGKLPRKLTFVTSAAGSKIRFVLAVMKAALLGRAAFVLCGHINLLPIAFLARKFLRKLPSGQRPPIALVIHGVDAWQPTNSRLVNKRVQQVDFVVSVSEFTRQKFWDWAKPTKAKSFVLPNCVDLNQFTPGPKDPVLIERYGLRDRSVILTVARLDAGERYKGIDELLEILPALLKETPNLCYLIVGDGSDRGRLIEKAKAIGLSVAAVENKKLAINPQAAPAQVIFAGRIPEPEKVDHYRLADAFVMAGWGEGFGIVYLEAMACGIPVVASKLDASREVVLDGKIGQLANPRIPEEIKLATHAALKSARGVPTELEIFSETTFRQRVEKLVSFISQNGLL